MKVLINRSDAIGDTILTMPIARMIKKHHPEAEIGFIISPKVQDIFKHQPDVEHTWVLDPNWSSVKKYFYCRKIFKQFKPKFYFFVGGSHIPTWMSYLKRVKFRGGLVSKWQSFLFLNRGVRQSRSMVVMHELEYNMQLLKPLGISYDESFKDEMISDLIKITSSEESDAKEWMAKEFANEKINPEGPTIFIHPGMTGHTLNWSSRNYGRLITRLFEVFNEKIKFVVSYTPSDNKFLVGLKDQLNREEFKHVKQQVYFYNGQEYGLRHYMSCLKSADLFVGPSTGPTHMANCLSIPSVGIYSPIKVQSSMRWGPLNLNKEKTRVVVPDVVCGEQFKCAGSVCPYYECMAKIEVEEVLKDALDLLKYDPAGKGLETKKNWTLQTNSDQVTGEN